MPDPNTFSSDKFRLSAVQRRKPSCPSLSLRLGLQSKLVLTFMGIIVVTLGGFLLLTMRENQARMIGSLTGEARQLSLALATLSADAVANRSVGDIENIARQLIDGSFSLMDVAFYDVNGEVIAWRSREKEAGPSAFDPKKTSKLGQADRVHRANGSESVVMMTPIFSRDASRIIGYVRVGVSLETYRQQAQSQTRAALKVGLTLVLVAVPMAWLVVIRIFLPIRLLVGATRQIAAGDLDTRVQTDRPDVIGDLARAFNEMAVTVRSQQEALRHANQQLADANRDLESKVEQRTLQFETANRRLSAEIAEKEDFLRAVSHDLNAPLRNISGMVTMLLMKRRETLDEDVLHRLDRIKKNVEIETDLINELLELSRIKTRRQAMENVDLVTMINDLRGMFEDDLKTRGIELIVDTALPHLHCERARVRQVFQNLVDNAIKYMGDGPVRQIRVGCQIRLSEAEFYVRDTGMGIEPDDIGKVFFVFRRGKSQAAQSVAGKGVGLASVKSIVETYSGKIWVESEVGKGSVFRFTINGQYVPAAGGGVRPRSDEAMAA